MADNSYLINYFLFSFKNSKTVNCKISDSKMYTQQ